MAQIAHLLNQTCAIQTVGQVDMFTKHTYGASVSYPCRAQQTTRTIATAQKEIDPVDIIIFLDSDAVVGEGDKLIFNSADYRVMRVEPMIGFDGSTDHYEVLVQRWNV